MDPQENNFNANTCVENICWVIDNPAPLSLRDILKEATSRCPAGLAKIWHENRFFFLAKAQVQKELAKNHIKEIDYYFYEPRKIEAQLQIALIVKEFDKKMTKQSLSTTVDPLFPE